MRLASHKTQKLKMKNKTQKPSAPSASGRGLCALLLGAAVVASGSIGAIVHAPYLPRLLNERYPQPRWPSC